jgi:hypothetical protein
MTASRPFVRRALSIPTRYAKNAIALEGRSPALAFEIA